MILVVALKPMKALLTLTIRGIKDNYSDSFEPHKRGGEQKCLPRRDRGHFLFFSNKQGKSTVFFQANKVFNKGNALKRLKTLGRAVSVIEMASPFQFVSVAASLLRPPLRLQTGGVCFRTPELKFFNFL